VALLGALAQLATAYGQPMLAEYLRRMGQPRATSSTVAAGERAAEYNEFHSADF